MRRVERITAAAATINAYIGQTFVWGDKDCLHLAAFCLERLGYSPDFAKAGDYDSETGALRALLRAGFRTTEEAIDDVVGPDNRIDIHDAEVGDVVGLSSGVGLTAMAMSLGGDVLGFQHDDICRIFTPNYNVEGATYVAWRCEPCPPLQRLSGR